MSEAVNREDQWPLSILKWIASLLLFMMMAITFVDVIGRYILSAPIFGAAEMIQFLLAGTVFSGLILLSHDDKHVAVELFAPALSARMGGFHDFVVGLFSTFGLLIIGAELTRITFHALEVGRLTIVLEWPIALVSGPAALACFAATAVQVGWFWRKPV